MMIPGITASIVLAGGGGGNPPVVEASFTQLVDNNNTITVAISGIQSGDILIALFSGGNEAHNFPTPTGFTAGNETDIATGTAAWFWKIADGTETTVQTVPGNPKIGLIGTVIRISGAASSTPVDVSSANSGTGTSSTATSVTTTVNNTLLLHLATIIDPDIPTHTPPSGFTEIEDVGINTPQNWVRHASSWAEQASSGSSGTKTGTWTQSNLWITQMLAIKPA